MSYVTANELKATLSLDGQSYADADIALSLDAATESVNFYCGCSFVAPEEPDERIFSGCGGVIAIDDASVVTSVERLTSGTAYEPVTDYELGPLHSPVPSFPYTFVKGVSGTIRVTGVFGFAEVPSAVKLATSLLATRLLKRMREAPFGVAGFGMDGSVVRIAGSDPDVASLLAPYRRNAVVIA